MDGCHLSSAPVILCYQSSAYHGHFPCSPMSGSSDRNTSIRAVGVLNDLVITREEARFIVSESICTWPRESSMKPSYRNVSFAPGSESWSEKRRESADGTHGMIW